MSKQCKATDSSAIREIVRRLMDRLRLWRPRCQHRLRLCENLQLGDRRFLSVVEFGQQRFLVGGTANSLAMLAVLPGPEDGESSEGVPLWKPLDGELVREVKHG